MLTTENGTRAITTSTDGATTTERTIETDAGRWFLRQTQGGCWLRFLVRCSSFLHDTLVRTRKIHAWYEALRLLRVRELLNSRFASVEERVCDIKHWIRPVEIFCAELQQNRGGQGGRFLLLEPASIETTSNAARNSPGILPGRPLWRST